MPTVIMIVTPNRQSKEYRVKEGVTKVAKEVNDALVSNYKFVVVTSEDDKKFTLKAKQIVDMKAVD